MSIAAALLYRRFQAGGHPIAMVSMDNCAQNGKKLREGVFAAAEAWERAGLVPAAFLAWLSDEKKVTFPWSMIDKITPHPSEQVKKALEDLGLQDMTISRTNTGTLIAPFVNAETTEYLVLEDAFPNGRPPLERAGVYFTDRATVEKAEKMKVGTCLNPLHTALAVYGCLLGYTTIAAEMADPDLRALVEHIAAEGLPVVEDPGLLSPRKFIDEVLHQRFPNPAIPDTPQRIAADTSQKLPVRYGGTLPALYPAHRSGGLRAGIYPAGLRGVVPVPAGGGRRPAGDAGEPRSHGACPPGPVGRSEGGHARDLYRSAPPHPLQRRYFWRGPVSGGAGRKNRSRVPGHAGGPRRGPYHSAPVFE